MIAAIHQPNFMPWLGFFDKIKNSDVFVILDNVQFQKNVFLNRNRILTSQGVKWLTLPVGKSVHRKINEVVISDQKNWREDHLKTIELSYKKAPNFSGVYEGIREIYMRKKWDKMLDFNLELICFISTKLGIDNKKIIFSSSIPVAGKGNEMIVEILKKIGADIYLSGLGSKNYKGVGYIDEALFAKNGIKLTYQNFEHPIYHQCWGEDFTPDLSAIDYLFNLKI